MQAATIFVVHDVPPAAVCWPFLLAVGVYLLFRSLLRGAAGTNVMVKVSRHAFWIGMVGWLASSLQPALKAGILPPAGNAMAPGDILAALAWPVLGCLAAHALGQVSYPKGLRDPSGTRFRDAEYRRRVKDFLPRPIAWTTSGIFVLSALQIGWTSTLPGFPPLPYGSRPDGSGSFVPVGGEGRIPGAELAAYLGGALLVLAAGTGGVLALMARRTPLRALSSAQDGLLRTITMNRLLRVVATVAAGLGAIAGNHAAVQNPAASTGTSFSPAAAVNVAVLLAMWWWAPPKLASGATRHDAPEPRTQPAIRLVVSLGAAMGLAAFVPLPAALFVPGAAAVAPALFVAASAAAVLAVVALGELLIHRNYGAAGEPHRQPRPPVSRALMSAVVVTATVLACVTAAVAWRQMDLAVHPSWQPTLWSAAATVVVSAGPLVLARRRSSVPDTAPGLDAALRAITVHRVGRTVAAFFAAQAGVLLMSAGPKLYRASPLGPEPWDPVWQAASAVGSLLAAAAVVIAVIPVGGASPHQAPPGAPSRDVPSNATRQGQQ
ncbi:MAG: hypothetical protein ACLGH7_14175 [Actinomycetes bacterium]